MKISFKAEHVLAELKSAHAFAAIDELVDHLASVGAILPDAKDAVALALKRREQSMSTGIGFGVAIPHAAMPLIMEPVIAFGRSADGIEFDSIDGQPVRLVILMIIPAEERTTHLPTLSGISRLLRRKETREALHAAADVEAIAHILNGNSLIAA